MEVFRSLSLKPLWRLGWRYLARHPWQTSFMILGIMIGVAVMVAIDLANVSASRAFDLSTDAVAGKATHQITGGPRGLPETIFTDLRRAGLPPALAPVVSAYVSSPSLGEAPLQLLGVDPFYEAPFRNYVAASDELTVEGLTRFLIEPGSLLVSAELAERQGLRIGDELQIEIAGRPNPARIVGLLETEDRLSRRALASILIADIATAQEITGRLGVLDRIDVLLKEGDTTSLPALQERLPDGAQITPVAARSGTVSQMTAAFRTNLTALSLLALVVGMFLIYNTMTFSIVQRRPLFGTLRSLGMTRSEIFVLVLGEALLIGLVSSALGLALGVVLGQGALRLVTRTINDLFFVVTVQQVEVPASSLVKGVLVGVGATGIGAFLPALEAASVTPRQAMIRSSIEQNARRASWIAAWAGLAAMLGGAALLSVSETNLGLSFVGTFAIVIGFAFLTPLGTIFFMQAVSPLMGRIWGPIGQMAPREVVNSLSRTAIAVAALMVAVSVIIGVSLMVSSFRHTVVAWLSQTLQGDVYISPPSLTATQNASTLRAGTLEILAQQTGVAQIDTVRSVQISSTAGMIQLAAVNNPDFTRERIYKSTSGTLEQVARAVSSGAVLVSEPLANRLALPPQGGTVTLFTDRGERAFPVAGIYYDYSSSQGTVLMSQDIYQSYWDDPFITAAALRLNEGVDADQMAVSLAEALAAEQRLVIQPNRQLRDEVLAVFDRTFDITAALQLLATLVAFVGVLNALFSLQFEKQRQFGVLRAVGMSVRQLWQLVLLETGLMGAAAGLLAIPTGLALSWILIFIINRRSFGWTLQMNITAQPLMEAAAIALAAALLAGLYPAWRISRRIPAEAMRFE